MMKDVKIVRLGSAGKIKIGRWGAGKKPVHQGSLIVVIMAVFSLCSFPVITQSRCVFFSWPSPFFSWSCWGRSWSALPGTAITWDVLSVLGSNPSPCWRQRGPHGNQSYVTIHRESRGQMNACINPKGSCREAIRVVSWHVGNLDLLLNLPVLPELCSRGSAQIVHSVEVRSTRWRWMGEKEWKPVADRCCAAARFHSFISNIYLWCWWFPWPWDFDVKGKF